MLPQVLYKCPCSPKIETFKKDLKIMFENTLGDRKFLAVYSFSHPKINSKHAMNIKKQKDMLSNITTIDVQMPI